MDTSLVKRYQDEIAYLQSLLVVNGIPYDYEAYSKEQNIACQGRFLSQALLHEILERREFLN